MFASLASTVTGQNSSLILRDFIAFGQELHVSGMKFSQKFGLIFINVTAMSKPVLKSYVDMLVLFYFLIHCALLVCSRGPFFYFSLCHFLRADCSVCVVLVYVCARGRERECVCVHFKVRERYSPISTIHCWLGK